MSIHRLPNGKYQARVYVDGKQRAQNFDLKRDAQRWEDETTAARITGTYIDPAAGRVTFADFYAEWAADQLWEAGTRKAMDLAVRSATFGNVQLRALRRSHIEKSVKAMADRGLAPSTIRMRHSNVCAVLHAAVRDRLMASDPSEGVRLPQQRRREAAMRLPSVETVSALLDHAGDGFRAFIALGALAGLRQGEVVGLQVGDVEFLHRRLQVRRQVQTENTGGRVDVRAPKYHSERTIYLPDETRDLLAAHIEHHCPGGDPTRWMFAGVGGKPIHRCTAGERWRRARHAAGGVEFRFHDLRHFYASGLIAAGCNVVEVQRALGHRTPSVTLNTYAHLWPSAEDRTRKGAADLWVALRRVEAERAAQ